MKTSPIVWIRLAECCIGACKAKVSYSLLVVQACTLSKSPTASRMATTKKTVLRLRLLNLLSFLLYFPVSSIRNKKSRKHSLAPPREPWGRPTTGNFRLLAKAIGQCGNKGADNRAVAEFRREFHGTLPAIHCAASQLFLGSVTAAGDTLTLEKAATYLSMADVALRRLQRPHAANGADAGEGGDRRAREAPGLSVLS